MFIVIGGTGHVGSAVALSLLEQGQSVTVVGHDEGKRPHWIKKGAAFASVDIHDTRGLRDIFRRGKRAFLLNPPAPPSTDVDVEERKSATALVAAVADSGLEKIVVQSTYGARPGAHCGDLGVLYELERDLQRQPIQATILRSAFLFTNWDSSLQSALSRGNISSPFPADLSISMVAPRDVGRAAADLLLSDDDVPLQHVEGPASYTADDVARAYSTALGRPIELNVIPPRQWHAAYKSQGFSDAAATSYACMTAATVNGEIEIPATPRKGVTTLSNYIRKLVEAHIRG